MLFNLERAKEILSDAGVDAVIATSKENVAYLSGHDSPTHTLMKNSLNFAVFSPQASPVASVIIPRLEIETWLHGKPWIEDVHLVGLFNRNTTHGRPMDDRGRDVQTLLAEARDSTSAIDALVATISSRGLTSGKLALDETGLGPGDWDAIVERLPDAEIQSGNILLSNIRIIKTSDEIKRLRRASQIAEAGIYHALVNLKPGDTDIDIDRAYNAEVCRLGGLPSFSMFGSGTLTAQPHLISADKLIQSDDLIRWDVGCTYGLYHSDTARAVVNGKPKAHQNDIWDLLVTGVENAIAAARPGVSPADLYEIAIGPLAASGNPEFARFHCGHGIGISIYDPPIVTQQDPSTSVFRIPEAEGGLQPGMVVNLEVGYYQTGFQGFLCEDTLLITSDGHERLTNAPKALALSDYLDQGV